MYTVEQLLTDAANNRNALTRRGSDDVRLAWDAFNRYVSDCVYKKQTLSVSNFCKIGWKLDASWHTKPQMRPHFNISEAFARTCNADSRTEIHADSKSLTLVEEFNFSKCALKFSQGLTKDLLFIGLRAVISQLAEAIASGQEVNIDMEVGTLRSNQRVVTFSFIADLFLQEGLDVPEDAPKPSDYRPSRTFAPPSQDALSLSVSGSNKFRGTTKATDLGGFSDTMDGFPQSSRVSEPGESHYNHRGSEHASVITTSSKQEICQQEALGRHIAGLAADANEAVKEHQRWESHCKRLMDEEKKDLEWRSDLAREYSEMLKGQIREAEERKAQGRLHAVEQASMHDYPDFSCMPEASVQDYIMDRRNHLKEDLDQQVEMKRRQKELAKQREREMEHINTEYTQQEMALQRLQAEVKKEQQKQDCRQAWSDGKRLREVKKEINDYSKKAPSSRIPISDVVQGLQSTLEAKQSAAMSPKTAKLGGHVAFGLPPATPRGGGESGQATPRLNTGSVRRFPIGAAASLALTKQRMQERGML